MANGKVSVVSENHAQRTTSKLLFFFPKHTGQIEHHTAVKKRKERASIVRRMFGNSNIVVELHVV